MLECGGNPRNLLLSHGVRPNIWPRTTRGRESLFAALEWLDSLPDPVPPLVETKDEEDTTNYTDL